MGFAMLIVMGSVIGIVCGFFLYEAARREKRSPWAWGIFGFLFSVIALVAFRVSVGPVVKM